MTAEQNAKASKDSAGPDGPFPKARIYYRKILLEIADNINLFSAYIENRPFEELADQITQIRSDIYSKIGQKTFEAYSQKTPSKGETVYVNQDFVTECKTNYAEESSIASLLCEMYFDHEANDTFTYLKINSFFELLHHVNSADEFEHLDQPVFYLCLYAYLTYNMVATQTRNNVPKDLGFTKLGQPRLHRKKTTKEERAADPRLKDGKGSIKLGTRIEPDLRDRFVACAKALDTTQTLALSEAIEDFLEKYQNHSID